MDFKAMEEEIKKVFGAAVLVRETDAFAGQTFKPALAICAHPKVLAKFCETRFERSLSKKKRSAPDGSGAV